MKIEVRKPEMLLHTAALPASKSISNRALIIHALSGADPALLHHVSDCDDTAVMQRALTILAAEKAALHADTKSIGTSNADTSAPAVIDIGAAGTSMRFLTALLAVTPGQHVITGSERMRHRPIGVLVEALRQLGAEVAYEGQEGFPPLRITGGVLPGGRLDIQGNVSSQYISALLMIAPLMAQGLELHLRGTVVSRPYIRMTVTMMRQFGADVRWQGSRTIHVSPLPYQPVPYYIEADWSAAAFWFEMAALHPRPYARIAMPRLQPHSLQGDAEVCRVFRALGVTSHFTSTICGEKEFQIRHRRTDCQRLDYDFSRIPDLAQAVVVTCSLLGIPFRFTGLQTLRIKETDRIAALCTELDKLGVHLEVEDDSTLRWEGPKRQTRAAVPYLRPAAGTVIDTYDDHRMAMAFAPAALRLKSIVINHPEVVSKSYPGYWNDLRHAGFKIEELD